ncbi:hypothetical protein KXJ72_08810 [Comamonas aquatica]|nr:hypothetical protein KXJ72_08810 [Comamonas aquatica]
MGQIEMEKPGASGSLLDGNQHGASIDQWLVDPEDSQSKIKLLKKLEEKSGKAPTQEQLGSITVESYQNG